MQYNDQVPTKLYHATYSQFLASIMSNGLGNTTNKMWTDSKPGIVYLAKDPWEAESYAEEAEWLDDKEDIYEYLDNIVILEIDTDKLDVNNLYRDENLLPGGDEVIGFEYHGVIPWEACKVFKSTLGEEFQEYENINDAVTEKLIALFWEGLSDYSSDVWFASSSNDKERLLWWALEKLNEPINKDVALDIFWQWADGLEEDSFIDFSGLTEGLGAYDVHREGESLVAYLDGVPIARSQNYNELLADIREFEKEAKEAKEVKATPTFLVSWIIEARTPRGYIEDSKEVQANTANEAIAIIKKQFPRARQLSAKLKESTSFAEEFKLVENLWN